MPWFLVIGPWCWLKYFEMNAVWFLLFHIAHFFFCTTRQTAISSLETCSDTTGWCLTQTIASKWNLLFSFYAKCLKGYGWKWNYFYCIPIVPQSTESAGVGFWPLAKTEKSFIFFLHWLSNSDVEMLFWSNMA